MAVSNEHYRDVLRCSKAYGFRTGSYERSGYELIYTFDSQQEQAGVARLLRLLGDMGIDYRDLRTRESSLEEIFVGLVHE